MTSHVIAYRLTELLFGTHTFDFNCYFDDFNCIFMQIRCSSRLLSLQHRAGQGENPYEINFFMFRVLKITVSLSFEYPEPMLEIIFSHTRSGFPLFLHQHVASQRIHDFLEVFFMLFLY